MKKTEEKKMPEEEKVTKKKLTPSKNQGEKEAPSDDKPDKKSLPKQKSPPKKPREKIISEKQENDEKKGAKQVEEEKEQEENEIKGEVKEIKDELYYENEIEQEIQQSTKGDNEMKDLVEKRNKEAKEKRNKEANILKRKKLTTTQMEPKLGEDSSSTHAAESISADDSQIVKVKRKRKKSLPPASVVARDDSVKPLLPTGGSNELQNVEVGGNEMLMLAQNEVKKKHGIAPIVSLTDTNTNGNTTPPHNLLRLYF